MTNNPTIDPSPTGVPKQIDPSINVKEMLELAVGRLDDLRLLEAKRSDDMSGMNTVHIKEILSLRSEFSDKLSELSGKYSDIIRVQEQERINAIRAVDVAAVSVASEKANQQAIVLANQVSASADTLRQLVASTATATAQTIQTALNQMGERLSALEKANYEGAGKSSLTDPERTAMLAELKALREASASSSGRSGLSREMIAVVAAAGAGLLVYLIEHGLHP